MSKITEEIKEIVPINYNSHWKRNTLIVTGAFLFLVVAFFGGSFAYSALYKDTIFPGVYVGEHHFGGLTKNQARDFIENFNDRIAKEGLDFDFTGEAGTQNFKLPTVYADDSSGELVGINSEATADALMQVGRSSSFLGNMWHPIYLRLFGKKIVDAEVAVEDKMISDLESYMVSFSDLPRNANIKVIDLSPLTYVLESEKTGFIFDYPAARITLQNHLAHLSLAPVFINKKEFKPDVFIADLDAVTPKLAEVLNYGNLGLNYTDPQTGIKRDWTVGPSMYTNWLEVRRENGELVFALNKEKVKLYLETLVPFINMPAKDAKFVMENDKVKEFEANQSGLALNEEKTYADLDSVFRQRNFHPAELAKTVTVSVDIVEPNVAMSSVNDLGILEIVGTGYSTFKDSHTNRIKNIANAVKRLNGVLIKPGEEFSANKYAGPYTKDNGFLPEQVIKGDKIVPEVGGGMCQIGTTLFRMAMNTGLPISERRNHSLVVSYYADPVNGNPGTDATLYEPSLDLKFINDTGNYMLLQTSIDYDKQQLVFTLWGRSDGRKGSYTHPEVTKWIPAGASKEIVSTNLKPGEKTCQAAFRGAVTSFTYTIINAAGEKTEQVFDSYYRPLPQICVVGQSGVSSTTPVGEVPVEIGDSP